MLKMNQMKSLKVDLGQKEQKGLACFLYQIRR